VCICRVEQLQASLTAQAAKQASLEEQLTEAQERLAMEDGNKVCTGNCPTFCASSSACTCCAMCVLTASRC
jgi:hypothetical protein